MIHGDGTRLRAPGNLTSPTDHRGDQWEQPLLPPGRRGAQARVPRRPAALLRGDAGSTSPVRRRPRTAVVVAAGARRTGDRVEALARSLEELGIATVCLGREQDAARIAAVVEDERADAVEVCLSGGGGVLLLRALLRELIALGRRDVSIVVHRAD